MAPTEGRVAKPEWWWDCHGGTPHGIGKWLSQTDCHSLLHQCARWTSRSK